jgi:hypothetical protein
MNAALEAFRAADFNWTRDLQSVWSDPDHQVDDLNGSVVDLVMDDFLAGTRRATDNPIGKVVLGEAGAGKTHLIGTLRRRVWDAGGWFVLLDIIGITDFWETATLGFVNSLRQPMRDGRAQYDAVLSAIVKQHMVDTVRLDPEARDAYERWQEKPEKTRLDTVHLFLQILRKIDPYNSPKHQDVVRALLFLGGEDWDADNLAYCWLQGLDVDEAKRRELGFTRPPPKHEELVRGMLWVMRLAGPILIAIDQIDPIVSASNLIAGTRETDDEDAQRKARAIIETLAGGLMALHDLKKRAMTVVSCLQVTWPIIKARAVASAAHRFMELPVLEPVKRRDVVERFVVGRLAAAYSACAFVPPYPSWPFRPEALDSAVGLLPRQILIRCDDHRRRCIAAGTVSECTSLAETPIKQNGGAPSSRLDQEFERAVAQADIAAVLDKETEDAAGRDLLVEVCGLFLKHLELPEAIDCVVLPDPDHKRPSLHARIAFTFHDQGDHEQHYCFRLLAHSNAIAFQARLKAAMTASGIDRALKFRQLFVLRRGDPPGGPRTKELVERFAKAGGVFVSPSDDDLRRFVALRDMARRDLPGFDAWLRARKPLFETALFRAAGLSPPPFLPPSLSPATPSARAEPPRPPVPAGAPVSTSPRPATPIAPPPMPASPAAPARSIPVGRRFERGAAGAAVTLAADLLPRHIAILAGSGSGKTVLLRRIVEEAALVGIPSIVLDVNNDLARLGERWPARPEQFSDEDAAKADAYHAGAEVVIWTPGVSAGNPLSLDLLPDFAAIGAGTEPETEDERTQAVEMARATLSPYLGGSGQRAQLRQGVLADALRSFAIAGGGTLEVLADFLSDPPDDFSRIGNAAKLAAEIANQLRAVVATNQLLRASGTSLDPRRLFSGDGGRPRISVVNLAGLGSDDARQAFVNQLQMTLFTWIKQNPSPTGRLYVLDEAQNFAPSQEGTACKASTRSLAAQARKYGLGMIFATQMPRGIDGTIVSNATTHVYGRMSSPAALQAIHELMAAKGGAAGDVAGLGRGEFYFSTEGLSRPVKIRTPLCLSWHPANPPTADEVVAMARRNAAL